MRLGSRRTGLGSLLYPLDWERNVSEWIAGILAIGLLLYLFLAMLKPEWFA